METSLFSAFVAEANESSSLNDCDYERYSFSLSQEKNDELIVLANKLNVSKTEVIRRALMLFFTQQKLIKLKLPQMTKQH